MNTDILAHGAVGDGKTLNTAAIQSAVDYCHQTGGGRVSVPAGRYVTGTVWLKSNVELHLEHNAVLKGSDNMADYNKTEDYPQNYDVPAEKWCGKHLILAVEQENVSITGSGAVEGCADTAYSGPLRGHHNFFWPEGYYETEDGAPLRPGQLIVFVECARVEVCGVTIRKSACWNLFFHGCDYVKVNNLTILGGKQHANTDGIDIDACSFVTVTNCLIDTGDDCIAIRDVPRRLSEGKKDKVCEHITISNCVLSGSACAIRFGVGKGEIRHVSVSNLVLAKSAEGFNFITGWKGKGGVWIHDVSINNVTGDDVGYPIQITANESRVERVSFDNFRTNCKCCVRVESENAAITDLVLRNVDLYDRKGVLRFPEAAAKERRNAVWNFKGVNRLVLDKVRFFAADDYFEDREKVIHAENTSLSRDDLTLIHKNAESPVEIFAEK